MHEEDPDVPPRAHLAVVVPDFDAALARLREHGFEAERQRANTGAPRGPTRSPPAATGSS